MKEKLYIVIPAYNEEENIERVAKEWHRIVKKISEDSRLVIVDDGSKDHTYEKLLKLQKELQQLTVLTKQNEGHGATLLYAYHYALDHGADYIFQTDSDGQTLPEEFPGFWKRRRNVDAVIGYRKHREDGISRVVVTKTLKFVLKMIFHLDVTDANTPYRLMRRELLEKYIDKVPEKFNLSNVILTVLFLDHKEKVKFIPITFKNRRGGVNSINLPKIAKIGWQAVKDFKKMERVMRKTGNADR